MRFDIRNTSVLQNYKKKSVLEIGNLHINII